VNATFWNIGGGAFAFAAFRGGAFARFVALARFGVALAGGLFRFVAMRHAYRITRRADNTCAWCASSSCSYESHP
jgi:hypothetical protein